MLARSSHWFEPVAPTFTRRIPWTEVAYAEVKLLNGEVLVVEGSLDQVEAKLSDAARSGQSRLAWFTEHPSDSSVGLHPAHVVSLKARGVTG